MQNVEFFVHISKVLNSIVNGNVFPGTFPRGANAYSTRTDRKTVASGKYYFEYDERKQHTAINKKKILKK